MQQIQSPNTLLLGDGGLDPFPFFTDAWSLYSKKGNKTVFISLGTSKSALADLEIAEMIGCPLIVVPGSAAGVTGWVEVAQCIKTHEPFENPKSDFSVGADEKWIILKNLRIQVGSMPDWRTGMIAASLAYQEGPPFHLEGHPFYKWVELQCASIGLSSEQTRIDILKVDIQDGKERSLLYAMLDAGFRPSTVLVNWSKAPDTDQPTKMAAGHLQNCGYALIRTMGTKFLYFFVDSDMYSVCSWEGAGKVNPLVDEIVNETRKSLETAAVEPAVESPVPTLV